MKHALTGSPFRTGSLVDRLSLIGLATSVLSVLLTAGGFTGYELLRYRTKLASELKSVVHILALNSTAPLNFGDAQVARENLSSLKADHQVVWACLYDRKGQPFARYVKPEFPFSCPPSGGSAPGLVFENTQATYSAPVLLDGETIGTISVCRDMKDVRRDLWQSLLMMAAILTSVLVFARWLSARMSLYIGKPIQALVQISKKISEKRDYSLRVVVDPGRQDDELRSLVDSFNRMLSKVEQSDNELAHHREQLEEQVSTRTAELVKVNRELTEELQARKLAENALRESEERYALAMNGANDGLWDWDLKTGRVYYSSRWKAMLGCSAGQIQGLPEDWIDRAHPSDIQRLKTEIEAHCLGHTPELQVECRMRHQDGSYRWMLARGVAIRGRDGRATRMAGSQTDITEAKVSDPLTGLANRILFTDRLMRCVEQNRRDPTYVFAVLFLDLDRFKVVNDSLGHLAGDQLLVAISERLTHTLRASDLVARLPGACSIARLGGDEFAILLENIQSLENARRVADRIQSDVRVPFQLDGRSVFTSVSIGVALSSGDYSTPEEILRDADTAMYAAKSSGKARYAVFDTEMGRRAVARLEIETDLRRALDTGQLAVHYQPEMALDTGRLIGFEALVRWQHPKRGLVLPSEFVPVAEETGLIVALDAWVLEEACRQMHRWHCEFPELASLGLSVNLSGRQFSQKGLLKQIERVLAVTNLRPESLALEMTESVLMEDTEAAIQKLLDIKRLGIGLQIDDFGTGYSSLSYLHRLPFDTLKIDRSFVKAMSAQEDGTEIVRTIMTLARSLRMKVVAEGIENHSQVMQLRGMGCNFGQGYHFSEPLDGSSAEELLKRLSRRSTPEDRDVIEDRESPALVSTVAGLRS